MEFLPNPTCQGAQWPPFKSTSQEHFLAFFEQLAFLASLSIWCPTSDGLATEPKMFISSLRRSFSYIISSLRRPFSHLHCTWQQAGRQAGSLPSKHKPSECPIASPDSSTTLNEMMRNGDRVPLFDNYCIALSNKACSLSFLMGHCGIYFSPPFHHSVNVIYFWFYYLGVSSFYKGSCRGHPVALGATTLFMKPAM